MAFTILYIGLYTVACVGLYFLVFLSGSCWLLISMAHDIKCDLHIIADVVKTKDRLYIYNDISKFIQFHSNVIQLSKDFSIWLLFDWNYFYMIFFLRLVQTFTNAYRFTIVLILIWTVGFLCGSLLLIQIQLVQ